MHGYSLTRRPGVLRALIARHPELTAEAEQLSTAVVTQVDAEAVAAEVEEAVLALNLDDLNARAGRRRWGYVEPTEAAWELLAEALEPFLDEMRWPKRRPLSGNSRIRSYARRTARRKSRPRFSTWLSEYCAAAMSSASASG